MKQQKQPGSSAEIRALQDDVAQLRELINAVLSLSNANLGRADQQQQILLQHQARIQIIESYIRGENEQN